MKKSAIGWIPAFAMIVLGLVSMLFGGEKTAFAATTVTIAGWLAPDSTHLANSLMAIIMPLGGVAMFSWIGKYFKVQGDVAVYIVLLGLLLGSIGADLSVGGGSSTPFVPFALIVVIAILLFLWWWNS